jgi:hypothetical protein
MIPKYHVVYYKGMAIHYMNGLYRVADLPKFYYISIDDAKKEVDKCDRQRQELLKLFDNLNEPDDTN